MGRNDGAAESAGTVLARAEKPSPFRSTLTTSRIVRSPDRLTRTTGTQYSLVH
jgi:hypothetical protein